MTDRLYRIRDSRFYATALLAVAAASWLIGAPSLAGLVLSTHLLVFGYRGLLRGYRRVDEPTPTEAAWVNGFQHGLRIARSTVRNYRKPWITLSEELGWDLAREQLTAALDEIIDDDVPAAAP